MVYCDINGPQLYTESQIGHLLTGLREIGMLVATSDGNDITHINKHTEVCKLYSSIVVFGQTGADTNIGFLRLDLISFNLYDYKGLELNKLYYVAG